MRSLEQSLQSKRSILLGKRKILGKYFQGSWSYLKWNGFPLHPLPSIFQTPTVYTWKHTPPLWTHTHSCTGETDTYRNCFSLDAIQFFWTAQCCSPVARPTDTLVYFSHAHFKFQHPHAPPKMKRPVSACLGGQKGWKISTSHHLHQNKNKHTPE